MSPPTYFDPGLAMWVVSDPDDVREVLLDPKVFRPDNALTAFTPIGVQALRTLSTVGFALPPTLANNGNDTHRVIRQTVARYFSPARVDEARALTSELNMTRLREVDRLLAQGETVDLVQSVVGEVPALVLFELLGLVDVDLPQLKAWSIDSLELFWGTPDVARQLELSASAADFYGWLRTLTRASRNLRGSAFFSDLVALGLRDEEVCAIGYFLLIAGQETTCQLISTIVMRTLADPQRWRDVAASPRLARAAVDDALREDSSVPTWRRTTLVPAQIGGVEVPAGASILLRLTGTDAPADLAFGIGVHRCLGARLARMEAQVALETASQVLPSIELAECDPPMVDLLSFRAPSRVLVRAAGVSRLLCASQQCAPVSSRSTRR